MSAAPVIQGWCPGAHRPMMSGDGLVMRVRPWLGQISAAQAEGLAEVAEAFGAGVIDITSRANLQIRGVAEADFDAALSRLDALDLLDADPEAEHHRNIVLDPLRGPDDPFDQEAMAAALSAGLLRPEFAALPGKFGFVIDTGVERRLAGISGDIRIERSASGLIVRADGQARGWPVADDTDAVERVLTLAAWFLASGGVGADGRGRLKRHVAAGATLPWDLAEAVAPVPVAPEMQPGITAHGLSVGFAFGQVTGAALRALAEVVPDTALRVTPYRMLFLPGLDAVTFPDHPDLITDAGDPLLKVIACPGAPNCVQASVETRAIGRSLAPFLPHGQKLHVSGCAKGCALPGPADLTLTGRDGAFDLVHKGAPWDEASHFGLTPDDLKTLFER